MLMNFIELIVHLAMVSLIVRMNEQRLGRDIEGSQVMNDC